MAPTKPALPKKTHRPAPLEIYPPSVPRCLVRGQEVSVYYNQHSAGVWSVHQRDQVEIALVFKANVCHLGWGQPGKKWSEQEVRGRHVCVIASGVPHECRLDGDAELLVLYVEKTLLGRLGRRKVSGIMVAETAQHDVVVWMLASLLRHLCLANPRPSARTIDAIGGELASWLISLIQVTGTPAPQAGRGLTRGQREKVMHYMQANLKHDIHVIDFAKQTGHSVSHFTELFVNTMGRSPYNYLKEIRVLKAYEMLLTGDYLAKEAALAVGYSNPDHFTEIFRDFCGYSPRELLRRVRTATANSHV